MPDWHWWINEAWWCAKALGLFGLLTRILLKALDKRTETVVRNVLVGVVQVFNEEFAKRDQSIRHLNRRISNLALANINLATIGLFPSTPPSATEKERILDEFRKIFGDSGDDFQIP
jgi:hypothetical protein